MLFIFSPTFQRANYVLSGNLHICPFGDKKVIAQATVAVGAQFLVHLIGIFPNDFVGRYIIKGACT